ncbi:MAG TPA: hypothetical protein VJ914_22355 [Pseudonocardiaceae bacterium]|nr:hypothetical protein [Pseudonocardiaceae bacterium]
MTKPTTFADLAQARISQQTWQTDLPEQLDAAAALAKNAEHSLHEYLRYLREASVPDAVEDRVEQAKEAMEQVGEAFDEAAEAARNWAQDVHVPDFSAGSGRRS